ncbi:MAG: rhodanese-like domain-containing protein [bacterium]|nr:rhodanese-like domain-containing protein [bacterium]
MANKKLHSPWTIGQAVFLVLFAVLLVFAGVKFWQNPNQNPFVQVLPISQGSQISVDQFSKGLEKKDFILINVHTPYEGEIVKTDLFIDFDKIEQRQGELPKDKTSKIILYCKSGKMSGQAAKKLQELGYSNVSSLAGGMDAWQKADHGIFNIAELQKAVLPDDGITAPVKWGNLGPTLVSLGVIDLEKFKKGLNPSEAELAILTKDVQEPIKIDQNNGQFVVDVLWAFGLAQKSKVYTLGPLGQAYKSQVGNFASTGGWTLGKNKATSYLGKYDLIKLTNDQQDKVYQVAQNVYRPCCGNPASFPDCNHGMAALGLIELMVSEGFPEDEIYKTVLGFNSFWFQQNYLTAAASFALDGVPWEKVDAKKALSQEYSSGQGAARLTQKIGPLPYLYGPKSGGGCGI